MLSGSKGSTTSAGVVAAMACSARGQYSHPATQMPASTAIRPIIAGINTRLRWIPPDPSCPGSTVPGAAHRSVTARAPEASSMSCAGASMGGGSGRWYQSNRGT